MGQSDFKHPSSRESEVTFFNLRLLPTVFKKCLVSWTVHTCCHNNVTPAQ